MKRYLVTVLLKTVVEADSIEEAFQSMPPLPEMKNWTPVNTDPFSFEEEV